MRKNLFMIFGVKQSILRMLFEAMLKPDSILISNSTYENLADQNKYKKSKNDKQWWNMIDLQSWQFLGGK